MFQSNKVVNVFAGVGVLATALFSVLGLGVASGRLRVSVSRTKSDKPTETPDDKSTDKPTDSSS
jgi:hypothetical protein